MDRKSETITVPTGTAFHGSSPEKALISSQSEIRPDTPANTISVSVHDDREGGAAAVPATHGTYPSPWRATLITIALCLAVFCMSLDNTIIATAIPRITDEFQSIDDVGWYGSAYLLTTCAFQLFFGKVYNFFSVKWVYLAAILIFELGSVVCGATPNSTGLIIGRAIAGLGAAGIFSGSFLITANTIPLEKRPIYISIVSSMYGIASIAGPLMGGAFTDHLSWRWCFYINLPVGAVSVLFIIVFVRSPNTSKREDKTPPSGWSHYFWELDPAGLTAFVSAVVCVLLALQWGGTTYTWASWRMILLWVLCAVLLMAFISIEMYMGHRAMLPAHLVKQRTVMGATCFAAAVGATFYSMIYILPIWFQIIKGVNATKSGIMNLPVLVSMILCSIISGAAVTTFGHYKPFCIVGAVIMSVGAGLITTWKVDTGHASWIGYQVLYGVGVGFSFQQPLIAVQTVLPEDLAAVGTALVIFAQSFGGAVFLSVSQKVFTLHLIDELVAIVPTLTPRQITRAGATQLSSIVPAELRPRALQAANAALIAAMYVGVATACAAIFGAVIIEKRSVKSKDVASENEETGEDGGIK